MLNDFAFRFLTLSESELTLIGLGVLVAGFLAVPLTGIAPAFALGRIRYLFAVVILTSLTALVPAMWLLEPNAVTGDFLGLLVVANLLAVASCGFLYGICAQGRARHAYGNAKAFWLAMVPLANLILHFKPPLEKGRPAGLVRLSLNAVLIVFALALAVVGQGLTVAVEGALERQASRANGAPDYQAARAAGFIDAIGLEDFLKMEADMVRPERVDAISLLASATARGSGLIFNYELDVARDRISDTMRGRIVGRLCAMPSLEPVFDAGGTWIFAYENAAGVDMGEIRANADVCAAAEALADKTSATPVERAVGATAADQGPRAGPAAPRVDLDRLQKELTAKIDIETPQRRREAFEEMIDASPMAPAYEAMRSYFPEDYEAMIDELVTMADTEINAAQAFALSHEIGARLRRENADSLSSAPDALLSSALMAQSQALREMQEVDPAMCARFAVTGGSGMSDYTDDILGEIAEAAAVMFRAMYVGSTMGQQHGTATDADFARAMDDAVEFYLADGDLELIVEPDASDPRTCSAMRRFLEALATNERSGAARVRAEMVGILASQ